MAHDDGDRLLNPLLDLELRVDHLDSEVGTALVADLMDDLAARYGGPDPDAPAPSDFHAPRGVFLVAWADGQAVACGGVRSYVDEQGVGEIKRMYTRPEVRRRGISRTLLVELEAHARGFGYRRLVLETGTKQPEAMAMYQALGYELIPSYGEYKDYPTSRCYGKNLCSDA